MQTDLKTGAFFKPALYIIILIVVVIIFWVVLRKLGIIKTAAQQAASKQLDEEKAQTKVIETTISQTDWFNPKTFTNYPSDQYLADDKLRGVAQLIYFATIMPVAFMNTAEPIVSAFKALPNKMNISKVAMMFAAKYGSDMATHMNSNLTNNDLKKVYDAAASIPDHS